VRDLSSLLPGRRRSPPTGLIREVTAPDGTEWEICASRLVPPKWRPGDDDQGMFVARWGVVFGEGPLSALYNGLLLPMFRYMFEMPGAIAKGRKSKVIWIDAKSYYPVREAYYWTTSADHVVSAIDDIARGLAAGETAPRSMKAFYHGTSQSWTGNS
jgi:hypothetical protein